MTEVGNRIRKMRKDRHISQAALAEMAGVSISSLRSYEYGKRKPKQESQEAIMRVLLKYPAKFTEVAKDSESTTSEMLPVVDLAQDKVAYSWKDEPLTTQQVGAMRTVVKAMVEPEDKH